MEVTAYFPIFEAGHLVTYLTVHIDPASHAVQFEDKDGKRHRSTDERASEILADIHRYDPDKWRELRRRSHG
jgi:hypothetical protein